MRKKEARKRPSWDEYFINITIETAKRSSCLKRNVGAIIVKDNIVLKTGYNGAPRGIESCFEKRKCWRRKEGIEHGKDKDLCMAAHAESNAIYQAARKGSSVEGAEIYATLFPCPSCAKAIINSGIIQVNYLFDYYGRQYDFAKYLLNEAGIKIRKIKNHKKIDSEFIR